MAGRRGRGLQSALTVAIEEHTHTKHNNNRNRSVVDDASGLVGTQVGAGKLSRGC